MNTQSQMTKVFALAALVLLWTHQSFAAKMDYEEVEVKGGGTVSGTVQYKGDPPAPIMQNLLKEKNPEFCTTHPDANKDGIRPIHKAVVKDGKLVNAVVFIENIAKGKAWSQEPIHFDFKNCDIFPRVSVVRKAPKEIKEGLVMIENQDENILHNPHGYNIRGAKRTTLFNKPLPSKNDVADVTKNMSRFKAGKDDHFFLQCDQHNFMEADARIVWNPYYAVTGMNGTFKLDQVPEGTYKITVWHPYAGETTQEVTVAAGADAQAAFELAAQ